MNSDGPMVAEIKPTIRFTDKEMPDLKDRKIGETVNLYVKAKVVSLGLDRWVKGNPLEGTLEISSVSENTKQTLSQEEEAAIKIKAGRNRV